MNKSTKTDKEALERAMSYLYRVCAELNLITASDEEGKLRLERAQRMAADNALRIEDHLRGF